MEQKCYYRLWAEVDLDAIRTNVQQLQKHLGKGVKTCAVIKADGYGHGALALAETLEDLADYYAVATMEEAMELRLHQVDKPVLILGYVHASQAEAAIRQEISLTVFNLEMAQQISDAAVRLHRKARIHIKVDTGMSRIGFFPNPDSASIVRKISDLPGIELEGIFTHFACSDAESPASARRQLELFLTFIRMLEQLGIAIPVKHCANSAAATCLREADLDMVRLGISIYGLYPSEYIHQQELLPALSLKSHVIMVKTIPAGTCVGYGGTWTAERDSRIATIPVGYADGYLRSLSNKGSVLIRGAKYPVAGRVCMDQIMVDVTGGQVEEGDEVVLIGKSGDLQITAEEISALAGSFNYEFVCGLGRRVPRIYFRNGQPEEVRDYFSAALQDFVDN